MNIPVRRSSRGWIVRLVIIAAVLALSTSIGRAASQPTKATIHIPSKSLALMPFYFGKDKGFFSQEGVEIELVAMSPPTAIAALVAGELDFSTTLGAATSAIMQGHPLKRIFYVQQDPALSLIARPEIKSVQELSGKVIAVNAPTDGVGMSARMILKGNGIDPLRVTFLATQVSENSYRALMTGKVAATVLPPPYVEEAEAKGYSRLAEAKDHAPLSFIGIVATVDALKKNSQKAHAVIGGLLRTMAYLHNPTNRNEVIQYIARFHKLDPSLAEKAFASTLPSYSKDGTKPRKAIEREIEIYRETLKIAKSFTPDDLEDLSFLKKVHEASSSHSR
jgi:ABC-type nitrate/sulfonate/bicarbonate transport system substrate-binding protein